MFMISVLLIIQGNPLIEIVYFIFRAYVTLRVACLLEVQQ